MTTYEVMPIDRQRQKNGMPSAGLRNSRAEEECEQHSTNQTENLISLIQCYDDLMVAACLQLDILTPNNKCQHHYELS